MATTYGSADPDTPSIALAYVAIPLAIVVTLGLMAILLHTHRRKRLLKQRLQYVGSNPGARRALERDLQEAWMRGAPQEERRQQRRGVGRWTRNGTASGGGRWAWTRELLASRSEEGLNEFGEAPPPYDGRRRGSKTREGGDAVELEVTPSGSGSGSGSARLAEESAAGQGSDQETERSSHLGLPPAYDRPSGVAPGVARIAVPPPAVTHDLRLSRPSA